MLFFLFTLCYFSFGMINSSLGELGCLIRIISSLGISVHGSAYRPHHVRGSSTRYNPYPTPTHLITNSIHPLVNYKGGNTNIFRYENWSTGRFSKWFFTYDIFYLVGSVFPENLLQF